MNKKRQSGLLHSYETCGLCVRSRQKLWVMCVISLDTNAGYKCQNPAFTQANIKPNRAHFRAETSLQYQQNIPLVTFSPPLIQSKPQQTSDIKTCLNGTQWVQTQYILLLCIWQVPLSEVTYSAFKVLLYTFNQFWVSLGYPQSWHYQPQSLVFFFFFRLYICL